MSVLIKGMKMPTCCADCDLHNPFSETPYCRRLLQAIPREGRLENCPFVEVKTPHGRLIDGKLLFRNVEHNRYMWKHGYKVLDVLGDIEDAPTVIESEEV